MKNETLAKFAIHATVFYFTLAGFCQNIHAQSEVRLRMVHDTIAIVSLMANGQGPFDFVLDTGTNTTEIDQSIAWGLSLTAIDRVQIETLAGSQAVVRSSMRSLAAGPASVENVEVLVRDLSEMRKVDSHIAGIVGQNFLSHFNYLLDYRKHSVRFELASEIRDGLEGDSVPIERRENLMLVSTEAQTSSRASLHLMLDSGANFVVLIRKPSQPLGISTQVNWMAATSTGQMGMQIGHVRTLTVGSQQFHDIAVALPAAAPADEQRIEDGVLPTSLFRTLYVNNADGFVVFNPRAKKN
jgi:predicted aspartyl protease